MLKPLHPRTESHVPEPEEASPEHELICRAKSGDSAATGLLVRRYQKELRSFLARRTGNATVADDIAQDVLVAAIRRLDSLKENASFRGWLLTIARNKVVDHFRSLTRERNAQKNLVEILVRRECTSRLQRTDLGESAGLHDALKQCLEKLGPKPKQMVEWFYFENRTAESIASGMGIKGSAVRMGLMRIRKSLASCIRRASENEL